MLISGIFINSPVKDPTVKFIRGIVTIRGEIAARCNGNAMIAQCAIELRLIIFVKFATIHFMGYEFRLKLILYLALKLIIRPPYRWRPCCLCCGAGGGGGEVGNKDFPSFIKNCPKHRPLTFHQKLCPDQATHLLKHCAKHWHLVGPTQILAGTHTYQF